jgi:ATP-dependent DNA helicase RecG
MSAGEAPVTVLPGVGPKVAEKLARLGLQSVGDLLYHLPLRYEDRTCLHPIGSLRPGQRVLIQGEILHSAVVGGRRRSLVAALADGTGKITLRLFHFYPNQVRGLRRGARIRCFGEVRAGYQGLELIHPEYRTIGDSEPPLEASLTPIYPTTDGVGQATLRNLITAAREQLMGELTEDLVPAEITGPLALPELSECLSYVHQPPPDADLHALAEGRHPCQQRLAFEELLAHRLSLRLLRRRVRATRTRELPVSSTLSERFVAGLPFQLTGAQQRVIAEVGTDLGQSRPGMRLIQGDVGSGKTVVAAAAMIQAVAGGHQAAITAPTEILAEQHLRTLSQWFEPLGLKVAWLSGKVRGKQRKQTLAEIAGDADVVVGTHALMQEGVDFRDLAVVVVDEQHRFGVHQRMALREKGSAEGVTPHQLIMTATPIPRTLAMTAYADLDVSVIDELPPNRTPVRTVVLGNARRDQVVERVAAACKLGRQTYWVCTIIEESEVLVAEAAEDVAAALKAGLPGVSVSLVHGRLKPDQKEAVMQSFKSGEVDLLVATTVIEVGVDVPNASLMIIDNAERLGLSQLHQLRGRVGRGSTESTCVLLYQAPLSETAKARLELMRETTDGFLIAQRDLELRGPGEVLGTRQTGTVQFRIADLARDHGLLDAVGKAASTLLLCQRMRAHCGGHGDTNLGPLRRALGAAILAGMTPLRRQCRRP